MKIYIGRKKQKDFYSYYTTCKEKNTENKCFLTVQFTKESGNPATDQIDIRDCFFSAYSGKESVQPKVVVKSFEDIGTNLDEKEALYNTKATTKTDPYASFGDTIEIDPSEDLPF